MAGGAAARHRAVGGDGARHLQAGTHRPESRMPVAGGQPPARQRGPQGCAAGGAAAAAGGQLRGRHAGGAGRVRRRWRRQRPAATGGPVPAGRGPVPGVSHPRPYRRLPQRAGSGDGQCDGVVSDRGTALHPPIRRAPGRRPDSGAGDARRAAVRLRSVARPHLRCRLRAHLRHGCSRCGRGAPDPGRAHPRRGGLPGAGRRVVPGRAAARRRRAETAV